MLLGYLGPINTHIFSETTLWLCQCLSKIHFCGPCSHPDEGCSLGSLATGPEQWLSTRTILPPGAHLMLPGEIAICLILGQGSGSGIYLIKPGMLLSLPNPPTIETKGPHDFN